MQSTQTMQRFGMRTLIGHSADIQMADLMCICALCRCGRHRCPAHPPAVPFVGETTYQCEYIPKTLPVQEPLQGTFKVKTASAALPGECVKPSKSRWLGKTEYQVQYEDREPTEAPTILRQYVPIDGPFTGRSMYSTTFDRSSTPAWVPHIKKLPIRVPFSEGKDAVLEGVGTHESDYPPWNSRPADSFKRHQNAATDLPFTGTTHSSEEYTEKRVVDPHPGYGPPAGPAYIAAENRTWSTESVDQFYPRVALADQVCPSRLLPPPPAMEAAPGAYEGEHVLWDTTRKQWSMGGPPPGRPTVF